MNRCTKIIDYNTSGSGRKTWELNEDMDAILGDKPNIKPTTVQETDLSDDDDDKKYDSALEKEEQNEDKKSRKRNYKSSADKVDSIFQQFMQEKRKADDEREKKRQAREQEKEEQRERRHNEKQELLKAFLEILSKKRIKQQECSFNSQFILNNNNDMFYKETIWVKCTFTYYELKYSFKIPLTFYGTTFVTLMNLAKK